ncbi:hypothetical protein EGW08_004363, partial [Elysia chlorotica]
SSGHNSSGHSSGQGVPTVRRLGRHGNQGEYRCTATTASGSVVSQPAVLSLPVLEEFPPGENQTVQVPQGGYVTLACPAPYSLPQAEVLVVGPAGRTLWDGSSPAGDIQRLPSGAVVLSRLTTAAAGTYSCVAVNTALGRNVTSPYVINLVVTQPSAGAAPQPVGFLRGPRRSVRAVVESSVTLECPSYGPTWTTVSSDDHSVARPRVVWSRDGGSLPPGRFRIDHLGNLVLHRLDILDAGTYICSESHASSLDLAHTQADAAQGQGEGQGQGESQGHRAAAVWVDHPQVLLQIISAPVARIITPLEDAVAVGEAVRLDCFSGGHPAPELAWYHNGRRLGHADMSDQLVLPQVTLADAGLYQCLATNEVGSAQSVARLRITDMPVTRDEEEDEDLEGEKDEVKTTNNGASVNRANRRRDRKKNGRRRDMRLKERRKKKNQQNFGYSDGREKPKYAPSTPEVVQLSDRSVKLSWTVQDKGNGQTIRFFKVQYKEMAPQKTWKTCDPQLAFSTRDFEVNSLKPGASYKFRVLAVYEDNDNRNSASTDVFTL